MDFLGANWYAWRLRRQGGASNGRRPVISAKIFVGNLNYQTTQNELREFLKEAGEIVDVYLPSDRATGRPRGFAFVEFSSEDEAATAIEKFNGQELGGRPLRLDTAEDRPRRAPSAPSGGFQDSPGWGGDSPGGRGRPSKPKGSRRGLRGRKRSL